MKGLIFTYVLTYGGALASLFDPYYGLLVYFCFSIIKPESMWFWSVPAGNYSRIIALALLVGWAIRGLGNWQLNRAWGIVKAFGGFWCWALICGQFAADPSRSMVFVEQQAKILLPFLAGLTLIDSTIRLRQAAWVLALSQGYVALELNRSYLAGYNRVLDMGFGGMDNNCNAIAMVAGAGLAFFLGLGEKAWYRKLLCFGMAAMMAHVTMFAMSRGGMLALCITGVVSFVLIPKQPKHYLAFALAVLVGWQMAGPEVTNRFVSAFADEGERDASAQSRVDMWKDCWDLTLKNPIVGVGPRHWPMMAPIYGWPLYKEAHTLWFQTSAEMGFPGLGLLATFYGLTIWRMWGLLRSPPAGIDPWLQDAARMVIAALVGFTIAATFVTITGLEFPYYIVLLGAGALKLSEVQLQPSGLLAPQT